MDFNEDLSQAKVVIQSYTDGVIKINHQDYCHPIVITPENITENFLSTQFENITEDHIDRLCQSGAEVILLGTGNTQKRLPKNLFIRAAKNKKSIDVMSTAAACRTFSVLSTDGRMVIAALFT